MRPLACCRGHSVDCDASRFKIGGRLYILVLYRILYLSQKWLQLPSLLVHGLLLLFHLNFFEKLPFKHFLVVLLDLLLRNLVFLY